MSSKPSPISEAPTRRAALLERLAASGPFGFGASSLGNLYRRLSDGEAKEAVDAAWAAGIRYFDTAPFYGFGLSERRLGDALREHDRDAYLLSTKAGRLLFPADPGPGRDGFQSPMPFAPVFDYSYDGIMRSIEASLQRLGLGRIDILYLHDLGRATHGDNHSHMFRQALDGGFRALMSLRDQGVVEAVGLGVNETAICEESLAFADFDLFLIAGRVSLLDASGAGFLEMCRRRGIGVAAAGIFSSGILASGAAAANAYHDYAPASEEIREKVSRMERVCGTFGIPLPAAALHFVTAFPGVTLPVVGISNAAEVSAAVSFTHTSIPDGLWDALRLEGLLPAEAPV